MFISKTSSCTSYTIIIFSCYLSILSLCNKKEQRIWAWRRQFWGAPNISLPSAQCARCALSTSRLLFLKGLKAFWRTLSTLWYISPQIAFIPHHNFPSFIHINIHPNSFALISYNHSFTSTFISNCMWWFISICFPPCVRVQTFIFFTRGVIFVQHLFHNHHSPSLQSLSSWWCRHPLRYLLQWFIQIMPSFFKGQFCIVLNGNYIFFSRFAILGSIINFQNSLWFGSFKLFLKCLSYLFRL